MVLSAQQLQIIISAKDLASKALDAVKTKTDSLVGSIEKHSGALKALGIVGAGVLGSLGAMVKGAETQAKTQRQLANALDSVGVSYDNNKASIEGVISALQNKTAVSDEEQRKTLVQLITVLGDYDKAMAALPLVLDAAAVKGSSLSEVATTLGRALAGQASTAESIGVTFDETAGFAERLAVAQEKVGGQAEAAATSGEKLRAKLSDMSDKIGTALLPVVNTLIDRAGVWIDKFNALDDETVELIAKLGAGAGLLGALAGVVAIIPAVVNGLKAIAAGIRLLMSSTGIGLLIVALGIVVGSLVEFSETAKEAEENARLHAEASQYFAEKQKQLAEEYARTGQGMMQLEPIVKNTEDSLASLEQQEQDTADAAEDAGNKLRDAGLDALDSSDGFNSLSNSLATTRDQFYAFDPAIYQPVESGVQRSLAALDTLSNGISQVQQQAAASTGVGSSLPGFSSGSFFSASTGTPEGLSQAISQVQGVIKNLSNPAAGGGAFGIGEFQKTHLANAKAQLQQLLAMQQSGGGGFSGSTSSSAGAFTSGAGLGGGFGGGASIVNNGTIVVKVDNSLVELAEILGSA